MSELSYHTLSGPAEGFYKEKGSKFLAFAYPVSSEEDIKKHLEFLRKKYYDARHHCFAWMLGPDKKQFRAFDDGEPNHSAGDPILGQIRSKNLTDVLIVVVRYFGGIKLGVGGLIAAYKAAAEDALNHASVIEKEVKEDWVITFDYAFTSDVMRLVKELSLTIVSQNFEEQGELHVDLQLRQKDKLLERLELMKALGKPIDWNSKTSA